MSAYPFSSLINKTILQEKIFPIKEKWNTPSSRLRKVYYFSAVFMACLVPLVMFGGLWLRDQIDQQKKDIEGLLINQSSKLLQIIDVEFSQQLSVMNAIANLPSLDDNNFSDFYLDAKRIMDVMPNWALISLINPETGEQTLNTQKPLGSELPYVRAPLVVKQVAENRKPAIFTRQPVADALYKNRVIFMYAPVIRAGKVITVLSVGLKAEFIQDLINQNNNDSDFLISVIDEQIKVIARSVTPELFVGKPVTQTLVDASQGKNEGLFYAVTLDNKNVRGFFKKSLLTGFMVAFATDQSHIQSLHQKSRLAIIVTGALSLSLAAVLSIFLIHTIVEQRLNRERFEASQALNQVDAKLLETTQKALTEQERSASEREILLREIYHRVKNNLQIIQSLLRLGARRLAPAQREPFESAIRRIGAMARIHTLLYNSSDLSSLDFKDYLEDVVNEIAMAFGADERGIKTVLNIEPLRLSLDTALPLALITVEILTNAYKHAFPDGRTGTIQIAAFQEGNLGTLTISDDGVGMPVFNDNKSSQSNLGLTIISRLMQQIQGNWNEPEPGQSTFSLSFPLEGAKGPVS